MTASLRITTSDGLQAWPSLRLVEVLDELAAHNQATLHFELWRPTRDGKLRCETVPPSDTQLDYAQPCAGLVRQARHRATTAAAATRSQLDASTIATIDWINADDL